MHTYTAIALLSLLGITLSASAARYFERLVELLVIATDYMFLASTKPQKGDRSPERGSGRREFAKTDLYTHYIPAF
ncbi:MAG: hypothetical protein JGK17_13225 [Microcoleus sp. PH2017_10_PVI_O_A]|uniref:heterocyst-inhibiting protein PatX n=1 Tax=unclassified Microcoleus TaxID=2642155 RepID=UPI001D3B6D48|nr:MULTISPECIES: hypothetical protein [unclassified Microcoleus]TAE76995.1 MAG: hypothetical protein EAZ83_27325 [Oscillatoriales cyanobacterium]MCC3406524.1 hypothetical protein [Microcoleus sp. PH2017_10_PVI_O_A]MCC3463357.1 hypothetical protein [Microcoleus sp. PH2017_11_PCY_U_A]MCC3481738.1 hypothetical protein [Microcoleus sp. PH2017_12_PCY_D_A]MCC3529288.1 hypothetical protein [Microcoleus sp. PH2017_21_RUC_O_A]